MRNSWLNYKKYYVYYMRRFSIKYMTENSIFDKQKTTSQYYNKNMNFYICSSGGCGSTIIFNYLSLFGNVYHIHDRNPPKNLQYIGKENTCEDIYSEWFNNIEIPNEKIQNYKVLFIYRNPIQIIYSRFVSKNFKANNQHLQNIKCTNNNISLFDIIVSKKDLYGIEEFYDNYITPSDRNYTIYAIKYELFWNNISLFNRAIGIPDIKELYPIKNERPKKMYYIKELSYIYKSLINKMDNMNFIELIEPLDICNDKNKQI